MKILLLIVALFNPSFGVNSLEAIAFVESSFNNCAQRGQYRGRFQQSDIFSRDLGHPSSKYVLCNRAAAEQAFWAYQKKYQYLTGGQTLRMIILHAAGPGALKRGVVPEEYLLRWFDAYVKICLGQLRPKRQRDKK